MTKDKIKLALHAKEYDDMTKEEKYDYIKVIQSTLDYAHSLIEAEIGPQKESITILELARRKARK